LPKEVGWLKSGDLDLAQQDFQAISAATPKYGKAAIAAGL